jgi:type I restriction enzyme R subunit
MELITEKIDVQDRIIDYLQFIGWEYLPPEDIQNLRAYDIKEAFLIPIFRKKLKALNKGIITDKNIDEVIKRLKFLPANLQANEEFLKYLCGQKSIYIEKERRENHEEKFILHTSAFIL